MTRQMIANSLFLRFSSVLVLLMVVISAGCSLFKKKPTPLEADSGQLYSYILEYAGNQADIAFGRLGGGYPIYSENGRWAETESSGWARGLYPGMAWLLYQSTQDERHLKLAIDWLSGLDKYKNDNASFGLGLVFYPAYVIGYQITGNRTYRDIALESADNILRRFNEAGFFPAFGEPGDTLLGRRLSIESMMDRIRHVQVSEERRETWTDCTPTCKARDDGRDHDYETPEAVCPGRDTAVSCVECDWGRASQHHPLHG